jgi:NAD(P)-dependent dehydrogenase (short-subunit alcohol dehydrogenase family)/ribulose-5-phosphate 4-epimerase/fuculose-1-phosphate aldolase
VLANQPNAEELCRKIFGDTLAMVPYIMPGFALAKLAAEVYERHPQVKGLLLINHGLFTFGDTAQESYDRHIEAVTLAEEFIAKQTGKPLTTTNGAASLNPEQILTAVAPVLRGLYQQKSGLSWTVHHRQDKQSLEFANSEEASTWSQMGPATPDHVIRTKQKPLVLDLKNLDDTEQLWQEVDASLETYIENYHQYFIRNQQAKAVEKKELDPLPRVILLSGCGLLTIGKTGKETRISADLYQHTVDIIHKAFNVGAYAPLDDSDLFDMEYWSLEQAKLGKATPKKLQGKVVYISGAASGIGKATARLFAGQGANLFLVDCDAEKLDRVQNELKKEFKAEVAAQGLDLTDESAIADSFDLLVRRFGGLDILVSNAGNAMQGAIGEVDSKTLRASFDLNFFAHQNLASQAVNLYRKQKSPGVLLFNASKAAFNPGKNFGPYALPKAAVIALMKQYALEYGEIGIRSNAINADRIRTGIFPEQQVKERAAARGLSPDEYFKSNLLHREVYDVDVAQGFLDLVFAEKTTGSVLTIDGGNIAASPR